MKNMLLLFGLLFWTQQEVCAQSIYDIAVNDIDGNAISLRSFAGKKVLFIVLPLNENDTIFRKLNQCGNQFNVSIVGILSTEHGYKPEMKELIKNKYTGTSVILTEPMKVTKGAAAGQSALLQWLTDSNKNRHFNRDANAVGMKFFVSESGRLYAVMGANTSLDAPIIAKILTDNEN